MPVIEDNVGLFKTNRRRIANRQRRIVKRQLAQKTALPRIPDGPIHGAAELKFGRHLRSHMQRQFEERRGRKPVPVDRHGPVRLRQISGGAKVHRKRQRGVAGRVGMQLQLLRHQVQPAADIERPALSLVGHQIPAVYVADIQPSRDSDIVQRTGQVQPRRDASVYPALLPAQQRRDFAQIGAIHLKIEVQPIRRRVPAAF